MVSPMELANRKTVLQKQGLFDRLGNANGAIVAWEEHSAVKHSDDSRSSGC